MRLRLAIQRIVLDESFDDTFILEDIAHVPGYNRQFEDWCGDISGRYIGALALCSTYVDADYSQLHRVASAISQHQRPTGLIGTDQPEETVDLPVAWGQGRLLVGLLEYHSIFPSDELLACASRLGDYYIRTKHVWGEPALRRRRAYVCYTQALEGLVALYRATGRDEYLTVAQHIAGWVPNDVAGEESVSSDTFGPTGRHSHGYMLSLIGMLALYEQTGDEALLQFVEDKCSQIRDRMLFVDGSPPELFPWSERDEGCSTADWLTLNLCLGRCTGEARCFEMAERVWRNALYGNQAANGGFCHHHFAPYGFSGEGCEAWWCCSYHGPRAFHTLLRHLVTWDETGIQIQFLEPGEVDVPMPSGPIRISQRTEYPSQGYAEIEVQGGPEQGVPLSIRIPSWAHVEAVQHNGTPADAHIDSGYLRLAEPVRNGDIVTVRFPYGVRLGHGPERPETLWYGPLLLAVEIPGGVAQSVVVPPADGGGTIPLPALRASNRPFTVPGAHFLIAGAGTPHAEPFESLSLNRPQLGSLRPLSEQTACAALPPAVVKLPVVVADTELLQTELRRVLQGRV
ncbi:MAG: hypothetical protein GX601_05835 [Anaerolineales bacterium]|nr:hypothetical protein [Anaerolineales bacterium]